MGIVEVYRHINDELADPRTNDWLLVSSGLVLVTILSSYLYFVLVCGPRYMQNRKAYTLKTFITWYNVFQIISNTWIFYKLVTGGWLTHLTVGCEPVDYSLDPMAIQLAEGTWWTYILKLIDLLETAIFVLRKKDNQISFLHLYHHVTTVLLTWLSVKYFAGGMCTFPIMVNSVVHVIMYSYYLLSARGPRMRSLVSFVKPHITKVQIAQFFVLLIHASQGLSSSCDVPITGALVYITNLLINLLLFLNFYRQNYTASKKTV